MTGSRLIIFSAASLYAAVLTCVLLPGNTTAARVNDAPRASTPIPVAPLKKLTGLPYRGVAMQLHGIGLIEEYKKNIDEIADLGADTVSLVLSCRQENGSSSRIFMDMRATPTPAQLGELVARAKKRGIRVILMPIVLLDRPRGNEWRGVIRPERWDEWFESYRDMMLHYAILCEGSGVDVLVVGSELISSESKLDEWTRTIQMIRGVYKGQLTYSANWDHYQSVPFWEQLDLIGMNSYWGLAEANGRWLQRDQITVETINARWREIQNDLTPFLTRQQKPLLLLEAGWCSQTRAAHEPWDYTNSAAPVDLELQRMLYEAFLQSWHGNRSFGGFAMWEWTLGDAGPNDSGYSPEGKPAEKVLRDWLAKPAWQVN